MNSLTSTQAQIRKAQARTGGRLQGEYSSNTGQLPELTPSQKAKLKLGKGKQLAQNATDTSIASKGISLPSQSLSTAGSKGSEPTSRRNLTLAELLIQSRHYSTPVKRQALQEALELMTSYPHLIQQHLLGLTTSLAHLVADPSASVRSLVRQLVHQLASQLPRASFLQACAPPLVLYTLAALSALEDPIRIDALRLVDLLLEAIPAELVRGFDPLAVISPNDDGKENDSVTGPRILDSLLSLLKVRRNDQVEGAATMTTTGAATLSDLSPEARLAVLSTLESFLAAASDSTRASEGTDAWYLAGAFSSPEAFQDFLAGSSHGGASSSSPSSSKGRPIEPYAALADVHANDHFALNSLGLLTPPTTPTASTPGTKRPSLLALLHPTLLSSFLDSAPTALNPSAAATGSSTGGDHLATVTAVVAVARQLFTSELSGNGNGSGNGSGNGVQATRHMLLAFLTHASPYFPFGADVLASTTSSRPTAAQQASEAKFLSLNLAFAELSSLLVLSGGGKTLTTNEREDAQAAASKKGKGRKKVEADKGGVEVVVLDRVQEWVVQALRGELTSASSPMGVALSPSAFESLTPTLWALLNQSDPARSTEVFSAVVDYFTRQQTNATMDGRTGEAKRRAGEFIARCVLIHSSPSYIAPFDLEPLASKLPATLSPNAKEMKNNALARWLVALPKYLWELGNATEPPREAEIELVLSVLLKLVQQGERGLIPRATLESLSPLLTPFFHLVHPKTHASHPGPFTRLDPSSSASRSALDLVWYLAGSRSSSGGDGIESQPVMGLVAAVERACALVGGEAAQRWESLRGRSMAV